MSAVRSFERPERLARASIVRSHRPAVLLALATLCVGLSAVSIPALAAETDVATEPPGSSSLYVHLDESGHPSIPAAGALPQARRRSTAPEKTPVIQAAPGGGEMIDLRGSLHRDEQSLQPPGAK